MHPVKQSANIYIFSWKVILASASLTINYFYLLTNTSKAQLITELSCVEKILSFFIFYYQLLLILILYHILFSKSTYFYHFIHIICKYNI